MKNIKMAIKICRRPGEEGNAFCSVLKKIGKDATIHYVLFLFRLGKLDEMIKHAAPEKLNDLLIPLSGRRERGVYFCRLAGYTPEIGAFLRQYYDAARRSGVIIDGRIPNPDPNNLAYFSEMMGTDFSMDQTFLVAKLQKWLPRMSVQQRENVATAIFSTLQDMQRSGKNENMLRNAYIKYMCWLYYKFERIVAQLGADALPKILYDGTVSNYELQFLIVLSRAGADILLLERSGDSGYLQLDPASSFSTLYTEPGMTAFPQGFDLKAIQAQLVQEANRQRLYGPVPAIRNCTNAWMKTPECKELLTGIQARGTDSGFFYNAFLLQHGVEDKLLFSADLVSFYQQLQGQRRRICLVSGGIPAPAPEEIAAIRRQNYTSAEQLAAGLAPNIQCTANTELQRLMVKTFIDLVLEEEQACGGSLTRLTNRAVYLLVWLRRYQKELFSGWKMPEVSVFLLFGACATANEALFLRFLSRLPVDVLVLLPDLNAVCPLQDPALLTLRFEQSLPMEQFPAEGGQVRVRTAAYQAERELDTLMYQDTGMYRNRQYASAEAVTLQTMYEEISILWDQEVKYRPSFAVVNETVKIPVLLEKICGVKDGQVNNYWLEIKKLITPDTTVIPGLPWLSALDANPMKPFATQFLKNGRLQKAAIKNHKAYPYGILRGEIQDYLLDKLQTMLDQRIIPGTYQNGTEYTVVSTVFNLSRDLLRRLQKFDFTKKNPKLILINTTEKILSLEDSIMVAFLNLIGFDILFFVPTGYQCIEKYLPVGYVNEQQIGDYMYDLTVPDFRQVQESGLHSIRRLFGRS